MRNVNSNPNGIFLPRLSFLALYMLILRLVCELLVYPYGVRMAEHKFFAPPEQAKNIGGRMLAELVWAGGFVGLALGSCIFHKLISHLSCRTVTDAEMQQSLLPSLSHAGNRWTGYYIPRALMLITSALFQLLVPLSLYTFDGLVRFVDHGDLDLKARILVSFMATFIAVGQIFAYLNIMRPFVATVRPDVVGSNGFLSRCCVRDRVLQRSGLTVTDRQGVSSLSPN